jgi:hypothetical protein
MYSYFLQNDVFFIEKRGLFSRAIIPRYHLVNQHFLKIDR